MAGVRSQASLPCLAIIAMLVLHMRPLESTDDVDDDDNDNDDDDDDDDQAAPAD